MFEQLDKKDGFYAVMHYISSRVITKGRPTKFHTTLFS